MKQLYFVKIAKKVQRTRQLIEVADFLARGVEDIVRNALIAVERSPFAVPSSFEFVDHVVQLPDFRVGHLRFWILTVVIHIGTQAENGDVQHLKLVAISDVINLVFNGGDILFHSLELLRDCVVASVKAKQGGQHGKYCNPSHGIFVLGFKDREKN